MNEKLEINPPRFIYPCEFKIILDNNLSDFDRKLYILIITLSAKYNYCFALNSYLAKICNCTIRNIQYSLEKLKNNNYIFIEYKNGKRIIKNYLDIVIDKKDIIVEAIQDYDWLNEV